MAKLRYFGMAGSLRERSYSKALLRAAAEALPADSVLDIYDLAPLPMFNADLERKGVPASVVDFHARMAAADALLIVTPEYNFSVPGVLKNAIDWASRGQVNGQEAPLNRKPAAIVSGGGRLGGVRAQMHLHDILLHNDVRLLNRPQLMLPSFGTYFDSDLRLVDKEVRMRLRQLLEALAQWTEQLGAIRVAT